MLNLNIQNEKIIGANNKILLFQSGFAIALVKFTPFEANASKFGVLYDKLPFIPNPS